MFRQSCTSRQQPNRHLDKLLENDRVIVWHYRWLLNDPTPMHFHEGCEEQRFYAASPDDALASPGEPRGALLAPLSFFWLML